MGVFILNNWMNALSRRFGTKKRNGFLWASLIGLGVSAAAFSFSRKGGRKAEQPSLQNLLDNFQALNTGRTPAIAGSVESAEELTPMVQDFLTKK